MKLVMGKTTDKMFAWWRRLRVALMYSLKLWLAGGRGVHPATSQLNLSTFGRIRMVVSVTETAQVELRSGRV